MLSTIFGAAGYQSQLICDTPHLMKGVHHFDRGFDGAFWIRGQEGDKPLLKGDLPPRLEVDGAKTRVDPRMAETRFGNLATQHSWTKPRLGLGGGPLLRAHGADGEPLAGGEPGVASPSCCGSTSSTPTSRGTPPEHLVARYDSSGYDGPPMIHPNYGPASAYTAEELANLQAHYAAEIYLVNKWIGYVLDKIEELGLFDDSLVVFTSDHGMFVGEHDRTGKSNIHPEDDRVWPLYEEISRIPLMIAAAPASQADGASAP